MGEHRAAGHAQRGDGGVEVAQPGVAVGVDGPVVAVRDRQQVGVIRGRQRADEPDAVRLDHGVVVAAVLPGVIDHGQRLDPGDQVPVAGDQLVDDRGELGDVGPVPGIGVADHRHPAVAGDHQRQPDQPQVGAFLFGLAALRDRRALVAGVDEGGEVGHVQRQPGQVEPELGDHRAAEPGLDLPQLHLPEAVHRVPEPAVIHRGPIQSSPTGPRPWWPTSRRSPAWSTGPRSGSRTPTPGRCPPTRPRRRGGAPPRRRSRPRPAGPASTTPPPDPRTACAGCVPVSRRRLGQLGEHLVRAAQILLGHDARLAPHPRGFDQVVVGLLTAPLTHDRRHIWVIHSRHTNLKHHNTRHADQLQSPETPPRPRSLKIAAAQADAIWRRLPVTRVFKSVASVPSVR